LSIEGTRIDEWPKAMLYAVAALSALAGLIHLWVMPEHFGEWWSYGAFFLAASCAQLLYVPLLLLKPSRTVLLLGIIGNSSIVLLWLVTREVGIPLLGPEAWEVEKVGVIDVCVSASEAAIVLALGGLLLWRLAREKTALFVLISSGILLLVAHLPHLLLLFQLL
jgi:hypothetical protein